MRRASALSEKTGTHYTRTNGDDTERDEEAKCVVAFAIRPSSSIVIAAPSAARRPAAFHQRPGLFALARGNARGGVIRDTPSEVR